MRFADDPVSEVQVSQTQPAERSSPQHPSPDDAQTGARPVAVDVANHDTTGHSNYTRSGRAVSMPKRLDL